MMNTLSEEQTIALNRFMNGENILMSGSGGSGKTHLIKEFMKIKPQSILCAMTGCAAMLLEGDASTIHSWSGLYWAKDNTPDDEILEAILSKKKIEARWKAAEILIVDEVSMMSKRYFDLLNQVGQDFRGNTKPFGGIQVVFVGDFFQLPPVSLDKKTEFCFESENWFTTFPKEQHVILKTLFRQTDPEYIELLNEVRVGNISMKSVEMLQKYLNRPKTQNMSYLFPTRSKTSSFNSIEYEKLKEKEYVFNPKVVFDAITYPDGTLIDQKTIKKCKSLSPSARDYEVQSIVKANNLEAISLKKGSFVMCTRNLPPKICNGSQGVITDFIMGKPQVTFTNGTVSTIDPHEFQHSEFPSLVVKQYPLCLAWAMTIHKIQGSTLDCAAIDIGQTVFEYGQTYVALSRVRTLDGLYLLNFNPSKIRANPKVVAFYKSLEGTIKAKPTAKLEVEPVIEAVDTVPKEMNEPLVKTILVHNIRDFFRGGSPKKTTEQISVPVSEVVEVVAPVAEVEAAKVVKPRKPRASIKPTVQELLIYS